jgi:predicted ABC-type ATPase
LSSTNRTLRLRVFAGPNGSGKSTIISAVRNHKVKGIPVDFGIYVNADDIAQSLRKGTFTFSPYLVKVSSERFIETALASGLTGKRFPEKLFLKSFDWNKSSLKCTSPDYADHLSQIIADYLRKELLQQRKKFSFETVFSHESKLDIMREAVEAGYKVYLYFVCTESPEINKFRVKEVRLKEGGHDVPEDKIESRYYRSLELLYDAAQIAYQAYFFDNSDEEFKSFAHFKQIKGKKKWDKIQDIAAVPQWFLKYYSAKVKKKK